jgi:NADPH:quinone reductase-like Zn-dependent oxidoreductase
MKALVLQDNPEARIELKTNYPTPTLKAGQALIKLKTAALNHRDQWCREGMYPGLRYPSILGSDGCGTVVAVADEADQHWVGKDVLMNPNVNWGDNPAFQSLNYSILGMPTDGTFAEYLALPAHRLHEKPAYLSDEAAAAIPLAALTAYRAVFTKGLAANGSKVLVTGIGGGVAQFAFQLAQAAGAKVYVTSGSDEKLDQMRQAGAAGAVNYKDPQWVKTLIKAEPMGFHTIIDSAGGDAFGELAKMLAQGGTMVVYGTTAGKPSGIHLPRLFFSQASITGSTMGNDQEFVDMLAFMAKHQIQPLVSSVRPLDDIVSAFDEMDQGRQFGKLVIRISE